jgi:hypothetical protein
VEASDYSYFVAKGRVILRWTSPGLWVYPTPSGRINPLACRDFRYSGVMRVWLKKHVRPNVSCRLFHSG